MGTDDIDTKKSAVRPLTLLGRTPECCVRMDAQEQPILSLRKREVFR